MFNFAKTLGPDQARRTVVYFGRITHIREQKNILLINPRMRMDEGIYADKSNFGMSIIATMAKTIQQPIKGLNCSLVEH
jgi:hypothetical protein